MGETPIQIFGNLSKNLDAGAEIVRSKEHRVASDAIGSIVDDAVFRRRFGLGNAGRKRINELTMMVWWEFLQCFLVVGASIVFR